MPRTRECDYCGGDIEPGTGTMLVRTDGTTFQFCSSKCERNHDLGREPRDVEWTAEGRGTGRPGAAPADEPEPEPEPEPEATETDDESEAGDDEGEADDDESEAGDEVDEEDEEE